MQPHAHNPTHSYSDRKVLPFETPQGKVPGHEIRVHHYEWMGRARILEVVFSTHDKDLGVSLRVHVSVDDWTKYMKRAWPGGGSICGVIIGDGRATSQELIHAEAMYANHGSEARYQAAPLVARDAIIVRTLCGKDTLLEIVGVDAYLRKGTPMECPWERDNQVYLARQAAARLEAIRAM